jgi:chromosome segregation ATPase
MDKNNEKFLMLEEILTLNSEIVKESTSINELEKAKQQIDELLLQLDEYSRSLGREYQYLREEIQKIFNQIRAERETFEALTKHHEQLVVTINVASDKIEQSIKEYTDAILKLYDLIQQLNAEITTFKHEFIAANENAREIIKNTVVEALNEHLKVVLNDVSSKMLSNFRSELNEHVDYLTRNLLLLVLFVFVAGVVFTFVITHFVFTR